MWGHSWSWSLPKETPESAASASHVRLCSRMQTESVKRKTKTKEGPCPVTAASLRRPCQTHIYERAGYVGEVAASTSCTANGTHTGCRNDHRCASQLAGVLQTRILCDWSIGSVSAAPQLAEVLQTLILCDWSIGNVLDVYNRGTMRRGGVLYACLLLCMVVPSLLANDSSVYYVSPKEEEPAVLKVSRARERIDHETMP